MNSPKLKHQCKFNGRRGDTDYEEAYNFDARTECKCKKCILENASKEQDTREPDIRCRTTTVHRSYQRYLSDDGGPRSRKNYDLQPEEPSTSVYPEKESPKTEPDTRDHYGRTLIVIQLQRGIPEETVQWLIKAISAPQIDGGAQLRVMVSPAAENTGPFLHISATPWRLLATAETMEIHKWNKYDELVPFVLGKYEEFLRDDTPDADSILTTADKHRMVIRDLYLTENFTEDFIPGYKKYRLHKGERIIMFCEDKRIIINLFPLHCQRHIRELRENWVWNLKEEHPVDTIRSYFGENSAFYFLYFDFYNRSLRYPALLAVMEEIVLFMCEVYETAVAEDIPGEIGKCLHNKIEKIEARNPGLMFLRDVNKVLQGESEKQLNAYSGEQRMELSYIMFATANLLWVTLFLEFWKRKCNLYAYEWGRMCIGDAEEALPQIQGEMRKNPATGRYERYYPQWKTVIKMYFVSIPIVVVLSVIWIYFSVVVVKVRLELRTEGIDYWSSNWYWYQFYGSLYSGVLTAYRRFYVEISIWLSKWENHRMRRSYENSKIGKSALLTFSITFCTLFYIAFVVRDFDFLQNQLLWLLIFTQFYSHIVDALYTYVYIGFIKKFFFLNYKLRKINTAEYPNINADKRMLDMNDPLAQQASSECFLQPTFYYHDYYVRLFQQFGLVFLFSPVCPMAAFWSYINNLFEIRTVAFKLCNVHMKPTAIPSRGIGMWLTSFQFLGIVAASTNCALLAMSPELRDCFGRNFNDFQWAMIFVLLEHFVLIAMAVLSITIPTISDCAAAIPTKRTPNEEVLEKQRLARLQFLEYKDQETGGVCSKPCPSSSSDEDLNRDRYSKAKEDKHSKEQETKKRKKK